MDQKPAAVEGKNKSGIKNEAAQEMEQVINGVSSMLMADSSKQGQQSGVKKTETAVKQEASPTQAGNSVPVNSSDDSESRDAKFKKYLKDLDCKIRETLKQRPSPPNTLVELNNHLKKFTENQMELNEDRSKQEQQLKEQCCQLVSLLQKFCPPPEVWKWPVWQQMSLQEQKKQTEQLKQLVEKYVVAVKYLIIEENMSMNMPQSLKKYELSKVDYTSEPHIKYVSKYCGKKKVLFLGMNTSKRGMELGGVPFCDEESIRNWLNQPAPPRLNAKEGPDSSGTRFWGLVEEICGTPEKFFQNCFVRNYCPLLFRDDSGNYVTLERVNAETRKEFEPSCDQALRECVQTLGVGAVVAVGDYPLQLAKKALRGIKVKFVQISHPSGVNRCNSTFKDNNDYIQKARKKLDNEILELINPSYTNPNNAPAQ